MRWSGEFLFEDCWAAYRGPAGDNAPHAHAALQLTLAVEGIVTLRDGSGHRHEGTALAIRAGAIHVLEPCESVVVLLCDANSAAAVVLHSLLREAEIVEAPAAVAQLFPARGPLATLLSAFPPPREPIDPRLRSAMDFLDEAPGRRIGDAALYCGLSPPRLRAVARRNLGVTLGNWQNWRMLRRAGMALARDASLVEAASEGGFADQAHFCRTMRRMTGLTPTAARTPLRGPSNPFKT